MSARATAAIRPGDRAQLQADARDPGSRANLYVSAGGHCRFGREGAVRATGRRVPQLALSRSARGPPAGVSRVARSDTRTLTAPVMESGSEVPPTGGSRFARRKGGDDVIAVEVRLGDGGSRFFLTCGRIQDPVEPDPGSALVLESSRSCSLGEAVRARVCDTLRGLLRPVEQQPGPTPPLLPRTRSESERAADRHLSRPGLGPSEADRGKQHGIIAV